MIINFKIFESSDKPKVGDYVLVNLNINKYKFISDYASEINIINNSVSEIIDAGSFNFNIANGNLNFWIDKQDVTHHSNNKKDLEHILLSSKYNI